MTVLAGASSNLTEGSTVASQKAKEPLSTDEVK
jgi:hypothetical protein